MRGIALRSVPNMLSGGSSRDLGCGGGLTPTAAHRELVWVFKQEFSALDGHAVASGAPFIPRHVGLGVPVFQTSLEPKGDASLYLRDPLGGLLS